MPDVTGYLQRVSWILRQGERLASETDPRPAAFALTARAILSFIFARWSEGDTALAKAHEICAACFSRGRFSGFEGDESVDDNGCRIDRD